MGHHVAPMARCITHAQKDGLVLAPRRLERRCPPRLPVHRIVLVLQQVGAGLLSEGVAHGAGPRLAVYCDGAEHTLTSVPAQQQPAIPGATP